MVEVLNAAFRNEKCGLDANDEKHMVTWSDHGGGKYDSKSVELPEHFACD